MERSSSSQNLLTERPVKMWKRTFNAFSCYAEDSSIHSLKYIGKKDLNWFERLFWLSAFLISLSACSYLIHQTYQKWDRDPVLVTFNERATPAWKIPFPAVTICPESKFEVEKFDIKKVIEQQEKDLKISQEDFFSISSLYRICDNILFEFMYYKTPPSDSSYEIADVLDKISVKFADKSEVCTENYHCVNFDDSFHKIITDEGVCYVYNMLNSDDMYKKTMSPTLAYPRHNETSSWSTFGYKDMNLSSYPKRILGSGKVAGMKIKLKVHKKNISYACKGAANGFRLSLHTPEEMPRPSSQYIRIPFNAETLITIKPRGMTTSESLKQYEPKKRQCYFEGEKKLNFFHIYTQSNCQMECFANFTYNRIRCVKFSSPHEAGTPICSHMDVKWLNFLQKKMVLEELESEILEWTRNIKKDNESDEEENRDENGFSKCDCLPSCSSIDYDSEISQTFLNFNEYLETAVYEDKIEEMEHEHAFITIVIREQQFIESKRSELYGWTNFLSSCGGFLGLLMGGSLLSLVEIFYHLVLKRMAKRNLLEMKMFPKISLGPKSR